MLWSSTSAVEALREGLGLLESSTRVRPASSEPTSVASGLDGRRHISLAIGMSGVVSFDRSLS